MKELKYIVENTRKAFKNMVEREIGWRPFYGCVFSPEDVVCIKAGIDASDTFKALVLAGFCLLPPKTNEEEGTECGCVNKKHYKTSGNPNAR